MGKVKIPCMKMKRKICEILRDEMSVGLHGGLYHNLQIDFTYNSNHIEGSRLSHDETRFIFETNTIGELNAALPVDDIVETVNHFKAVDDVILTAGARLTQSYIKRLHERLKSGTSESRKSWFAVGDYKRLNNSVGGIDTTDVKDVPSAMRALLAWYREAPVSFERIVEFHVRFERIHPFQDGNGRVGRLIILKECLKHDVMPFIIDESLKFYYYRGLKEWSSEPEYMLDTCRTGQDLFAMRLKKFGY